MIEISEQERRALNETLARATEYYATSQIFGDSVLWFLCAPDGTRSTVFWDSEEECWQDAPDFTRDPAASRELVLWLAGQSESVRMYFLDALLAALKISYSLWRPTLAFALLTADPLLIARAAREAIGGSTA